MRLWTDMVALVWGWEVFAWRVREDVEESKETGMGGEPWAAT